VTRRQWFALVLFMLHPPLAALLLIAAGYLLSVVMPVLALLALPVVVLLLVGLLPEIMKQVGHRIVALATLWLASRRTRELPAVVVAAVAPVELFGAAAFTVLLSWLMVAGLGRVLPAHPWLWLVVAAYLLFFGKRLLDAARKVRLAMPELLASLRETPGAAPGEEAVRADGA
jgi:hypothetical protein